VVLNEWLQAVARQLGYQPEPRVWDPNTQPARADNAGLGVGQQIAPIMALPEAGILPPGWYVDSGGALRMEGWDTDLGQSRHTSYPHLSGVTTSTAQTAGVYKDGLYGGPFPEGTLGGAKIPAAGGGTAPIWKNLYASIALTAGGVVDQTLIAAVTALRARMTATARKVTATVRTFLMTLPPVGQS